MFVAASAVPLLCFFLAAETAHPSTQPKYFQQIAREADRARAADRLTDAVRLYREGVRLHPDWAEGWWSLGSIYYDQDRFPEAEPALARFIALTPKPGPALAFLALCEYETRDYDSAMQHFRSWALNRSPGTDALIAVANFHWALLLTRAGRFTQAMHLLTANAEAGSNNPALVEAMGLASLRITNVPEDYPPTMREPVWLAGEAALALALSRHEQAANFANRLLLHDDRLPNVHYFRGTLFLNSHQPAIALHEFERELEISPRHVPDLLQLAVLRQDNGQTDEAIELCRRALGIASDSFSAHNLLGRIFLETGRSQEGANEFETALRLAPENPYIRFNLARAYAALGRTEDAQRERVASSKLMEKDHILREQEEGAR